MGSGDNSDKATRSCLNSITRQAHEHLEKGETELAVKHFVSAVERSKDVEDSKVRASCLLNAGACLVSLGDYQKGLELLHSAAEISRSARVDHVTTPAALAEMSADTLYNIAIGSQGLKEYDKAVASFKESTDLYTQASLMPQAAESLARLATCHRAQGDTEGELNALGKAQELYRELGDCSCEALTTMDLAKAYLRLGRAEEGHKMLRTAKMLCLRLDNQKIQGKLYCQFGLVYTSLGLFDEAILSFERALPLVKQAAARSPSPSSSAAAAAVAAVRQEASILQNIGAVYNEKGMFSEAVIYHTQAATLHGKTGNANSEAKCHCNLAFAHTQLNDYAAANESFTNALTVSDKAGNSYLKFQASEGLGAVSYLTEQFGEAVRHFEQALVVLDEIKQDTGIARERVREKLSDALEAEQNLARSRAKSADPRSSDEEREDSIGNGDVLPLTLQLSKHGAEGSLPPLSLPRRKGTRRKHIKHREGSSYDSELKAYMNTYREENTDDQSSSSADESIHALRTPTEATPTQYVREGSLAIGVDAREVYTTHPVQGRKGVRVQREIVPKTTVQSPQEAEDSHDGPTAHTQHSKVCTIV